MLNGHQKINFVTLKLMVFENDTFISLILILTLTKGYCDQVLEKTVYYLNKNFNSDIKFIDYERSNDSLNKLATAFNDLIESDESKLKNSDTNNSWYNRSFKKF
jgi:hypothetical protein